MLGVRFRAAERERAFFPGEFCFSGEGPDGLLPGGGGSGAGQGGVTTGGKWPPRVHSTGLVYDLAYGMGEGK